MRSAICPNSEVKLVESQGGSIQMLHHLMPLVYPVLCLLSPSEATRLLTHRLEQVRYWHHVLATNCRVIGRCEQFVRKREPGVECGLW